jgi:hypothetical protein
VALRLRLGSLDVDRSPSTKLTGREDAIRFQFPLSPLNERDLVLGNTNPSDRYLHTYRSKSKYKYSNFA